MKIAFLHTAQSHVSRFDAIIQAENTSSIEVAHFVFETLLMTAQKSGEADRAGFETAIEQIRKQGFSSIICTCSTYGELCEASSNIFRIDEPIVAFIVTKFSKIGIAYTLPSAKEKSRRLLEEIAQSRQRQIRISEIDCTSCWHWFEKRDMDKYEAGIAQLIKAYSATLEVVFLTQASMDKAKNHLVNEKFKVVSSPEFGVKKYLTAL